VLDTFRLGHHDVGVMERIIEAEELDTYRTRCRHIIDARSQAEYAEDHLPGAINIPMLDNDQRVEIGTSYAVNSFEARKRGAAYALEAIKHFLETDLIRNATRKDTMLIYCARGGQRSGALSLVLDQIGFPTFRLKRGYKSYRGYVLDYLSRPLPGRVVILYGYTGSAKTRILLDLHHRFNILDLEGCASHRGSLLGDLPGQPQPNQRLFETRLVEAIRGFDPAKPTLIEGESRNIGKVSVPNGIWDQMQTGHQVWLELPLSERVNHILSGYHELKDTAFLEERLSRLGRYLSADRLAELRDDLAAQAWPAFVEKLLTWHYDPLYAREKARRSETIRADNYAAALRSVGDLSPVADT